jgi:hypothetical protein
MLGEPFMIRCLSVITASALVAGCTLLGDLPTYKATGATDTVRVAVTSHNDFRVYVAFPKDERDTSVSCVDNVWKSHRVFWVDQSLNEKTQPQTIAFDVMPTRDTVVVVSTGVGTHCTVGAAFQPLPNHRYDIDWKVGGPGCVISILQVNLADGTASPPTSAFRTIPNTCAR